MGEKGGSILATTNNEIIEVLKTIAPGTPIREGLENILKAKTGGLIVIGDGKEVMDITDGGFRLDVEYTPARLYELAKMDGAIIISSDLKRILYANTQLIPESNIPTVETGTRHRTAERTAKQTGDLVISISQRRNIITIFKGYDRYVLEDTAKVITKANQALQTAEKYMKVFDSKMNLLNEYEFNDIVTLENVIVAIQRAEMVMNVADEVQKSIYELGEENMKFGMYLFVELFWDKIKINRKIKKAIYLDEIWRLIGVTSNKDVASFIYKIFKTIRKYGGSAVAITQDVSDLFSLENGTYGRSILNNSSIKNFFSLEEENLNILQQYENISDREKIEIKSLKRGETLMIVGDDHIVTRIESADFEDEIITGG